ncbi:DMT family transporter [Nocardia sp. CA-128927]|uniref:DMT family transporter n=1 Tax=Nocardia sp. CA-128927 TaxID=3239975 RepID=UPI003D96BF32
MSDINGSAIVQSRQSTDLRGIGALVLLTASFAMLTVLSRYLGNGFTPAQQVYLRTGLAFFIAIIAFSRWIRWRNMLRIRAREWGVVVGRTVLLYVIGTTLFSKAAGMTAVSDISFIAALPLVSALGMLMRSVRVSAVRVVFVGGSAVGVTILSGFGGSAASSLNYGNLLALLAMVAMSLAYLGRDWHDGTLNNHELTALTLGVGAVGVVLTSVLQGDGLPYVAPHTSAVMLWAAIGLAGVLSVLNVFLINYSFERVDPVLSGNMLTVECVWGLLFGLFFFGQVPTWTGIAGGTVIVLCALALNLLDGRSAPAEEVPEDEAPVPIPVGRTEPEFALSSAEQSAPVLRMYLSEDLDQPRSPREEELAASHSWIGAWANDPANGQGRRSEAS